MRVSCSWRRRYPRTLDAPCGFGRQAQSGRKGPDRAQYPSGGWGVVEARGRNRGCGRGRAAGVVSRCCGCHSLCGRCGVHRHRAGNTRPALLLDFQGCVDCGGGSDGDCRQWLVPGDRDCDEVGNRECSDRLHRRARCHTDFDRRLARVFAQQRFLRDDQRLHREPHQLERDLCEQIDFRHHLARPRQLLRLTDSGCHCGRDPGQRWQRFSDRRQHRRPQHGRRNLSDERQHAHHGR